MKLQSLKTKTAIEISDDDLLLIEDREDTKTITVGQFKSMISAYSETRFKRLFNECIDRVIATCEQVKFDFPIQKHYLMNIWIGSTSGNIQIAFKDILTNHWLTRDELVTLVMDEQGHMQSDFEVQLFIGGVYKKANSYQLLNFVDYHDRSANEWLYDSNAGFVKAAFGSNFTQNEIAAIRPYDVIVMINNRTVVVEDDGNETIQPEPEPEPVTKQYEFRFLADKDSFANAVQFVSVIPPGDPEWMG